MWRRWDGGLVCLCEWCMVLVWMAGSVCVRGYTSMLSMYEAWLIR